jgi:hypothetical protein
MPGVFGVAGFGPEVHEGLKQRFAEPWGTCEAEPVEGGIIGGHAFAPAKALHVIDGARVAVDGEYPIYRAPTCGRGNVVTVGPERWKIESEWAGTFPLYYAHGPDGLIFCSRLKPLARVLGSAPDLVGVREFLNDGHMNGSRSFFENIWRLLPGQSLIYEPRSGRLSIEETSRAWVGLDDTPARELAEAAWNALAASIRGSTALDVSNALMLSAGWDSRTLLAALRAQIPDLFCYSHGDMRSRELKILRRLRGAAPHHEESSANAYDLDALRCGFDRIENVLFPDWQRAGRVLAQRGVRCVSAGVYGEILGGHYGSTMVLKGSRKMAALLGHLWGRGEDHDIDPAAFFRLSDRRSPWYLDRGAWPETAVDAINADVETGLARLRSRGVATNDQLLEAFISETRGTQYINGQLLCCRAFTDITLPFTDRDAFRLASRIPIRTKVHNVINREMLRRHDPRLLDRSTAAALVPAKYPILIQEASRATRRAYEFVKWRLHLRTRGRVEPPRFGAWNCEFLRTADFFGALASDLQSPLWNKPAIEKRAADIKHWEPGTRTPVMPHMFLRAYSVDLMLR